MPVEVSYPGVYVQPIITPKPPTGGAPTSITAFIGRTPMGPVNDPQLIQSLGDYQRTFGSLDLDSTVSYMVSDFYNNGGGQGYVVRLFEPYFEDITAYNDAVTVADEVAGQAQGQATPDAAVTQMQKYIKAQKYTGLDLDIANRVVSNFQTDAAQWQVDNPSTKITPTVIGEQASQAATQAAPYGKATININVANTAVTAAEFVALQAYAAALGSPTDDVPVTTAAKSASQGYTAAPGNAAADYIYQNTQPPSGTTTNVGLAAAVNAYFNLPDAVSNALDMAKSKDPDVQTLYKDYFKPLTYTALKPAETATLKDGATGDDVVKAFASLSLPTDAKDALNGAAQAAADGGESAINTAIAGLVAVTGVSAQQWPNALLLDAANEGSWGNALTVTTNTQGITSTVASEYPDIPLNQLFNMTVQYLQPSGQVTTESFQNVTVWPDGGMQRLDRVLKHHSQLVRVHPNDQGDPELPSAPPGDNASGTGQNGTDSSPLTLDDYLGNQADKTGIYALDNVPIFNILCIPPDERQADQTSFGDTPSLVYQTAASYCSTRYAMLILDPPNAWASDYQQGQASSIQLSSLGSFSPAAGRSSAVYFPRIVAADPELKGRPVIFPPCGAIAGVWASTDLSSGVWKSPAGLDASLNGIIQLQVTMNDAVNGLLNPQGINCLRTFNPNSVVWGARTLRGATQLADEYAYISVQRTLLYIEDSLLRNTQWAVFEPNDETLWGALRQQITSFLAEMYRQGAFPGPTAKDSYFVKCDASTNPPDQVAQGIVNVQVGFAPLYPAEFVVITIQQIQQSSS